MVNQIKNDAEDIVEKGEEGIQKAKNKAKEQTQEHASKTKGRQAQ